MTTPAGSSLAWQRVNDLLSTKESVTAALLQHLEHVHATLPAGARAQLSMRPGELRLQMQHGSGRITIVTAKGKRFEARLSAPNDKAKIEQLLSEYAWSGRDYTLTVKCTRSVPPSWLPHMKQAIVAALCNEVPADLSRLDVVESDRNEVLLYAIVHPNQEHPVEFCVGHRHAHEAEECDEDKEGGSDESDDESQGSDDSDDDAKQGVDFDELASMLELTPLPSAAAAVLPAKPNSMQAPKQQPAAAAAKPNNVQAPKQQPAAAAVAKPNNVQAPKQQPAAAAKPNNVQAPKQPPASSRQQPTVAAATMIIVEAGAIKITRSNIVAFFAEHAGDGRFADGAEDMLEAYCAIITRASHPGSGSSSSESAVLGQRLDHFVAQQEALHKQMLATARQDAHAISTRLSELLVLVEKSVQATLDKIDPSTLHLAVPDLVREQTTVLAAEIRRQLESIDKSIVDSKASLCTNNQTILSKVEHLSEQVLVTQTKAAVSHRTKGMEAEQRMFELLDEALAPHGICITLVSGKSGSCDYNVAKVARPDVALELKAHAERVGSRDIQRFEGDLVRMDKHGIIVALHNGFVGRDNFQINQLPTGKFAVYLAKNGYDAATIKDVVMLLHRLDELTTRQPTAGQDDQEPSSTVALTPHTMEMLQGYLKDSAIKLRTMRKNLRDTLALLDDVQRNNLGSIERILLGGSGDDEPDAQAILARQNKYKCTKCDKPCSNAGGLARHMKTQHAAEGT
ncbi:hypothetical protein COO60DRAFT_1646871 [Scenedesmus sp. NREL 46B-D3]|nr:hypothetical protein COO60DRAFT_1646871 [Scenedesmus sp. NREL 46B-D3]